MTTLEINDLTNDAIVDAVFSTEIALRDNALFVAAADFANIVIAQFVSLFRRYFVNRGLV